LPVTKDHPHCRKSFIKKVFQRHRHAKSNRVPVNEAEENVNPELSKFEKKVIENEEKFEQWKKKNGCGPEVGGKATFE